MRKIIIGLCAVACVATPALAREGNPLTGVGVSVESSPGGMRVPFNNANEARAACVAEHGTFRNAGSNLVCTNARPAFLRRGRGVAIGRAGGAYSPTQPNTSGGTPSH